MQYAKDVYVHFSFSELIIVSKDNLFSFPYFSSHSMGRNTQWNENQELRSMRASQILPTTQDSCSIKTVLQAIQGSGPAHLLCNMSPDSLHQHDLNKNSLETN